MPTQESSDLLRVIPPLLGVVVGFALSQGVDYFKRGRKVAGAWRALRIEVEMARNLAESFRAGGVSAPLSRLAAKAFDECFPILVEEAAATDDDLVLIWSFYREVETLNRGLDRAAAAETREVRLKEHSRNVNKAARLIDGGSHYKPLAALLLRKAPPVKPRKWSWAFE